MRFTEKTRKLTVRTAVVLGAMFVAFGVTGAGCMQRGEAGTASTAIGATSQLSR